MKCVLNKVLILTVVCILITTIVPSVYALDSNISMNQKVVIYYPNGNWGLTPVEKILSNTTQDSVYMAALSELVNPNGLPVGCYDEFPESFKIEDVKIIKNTAHVTISDSVFKDYTLSDSWLNTLGDIICYNLFYMNEKIDSVRFLSSSVVERSMNDVDKDVLFATPSIDTSKEIPIINFDFESLAKMSEKERNQTIQNAISSVVGTRSADDYTVCIDPGHGGYDPGAVRDGVNEKDLNLTIALGIADYLNGSSYPYPTFDVIMTRSTDIFVSLTNRHNIANNANADIFISIHCNTNSNTSVRGATACYPNNHDVTLSQNLGNFLITSITPSPLPKLKNAYYQDVQVLRNTTMPATLMECGFMSNSQDLQILINQGDYIGYLLGIGANIWCQINI